MLMNLTLQVSIAWKEAVESQICLLRIDSSYSPKRKKRPQRDSFRVKTKDNIICLPRGLPARFPNLGRLDLRVEGVPAALGEDLHQVILGLPRLKQVDGYPKTSSLLALNTPEHIQQVRIRSLSLV